MDTQMIETQASKLARALNDTVHVAAIGKLDLMTVDLYQTEIPLSPTTPKADLVAAVADYGGYAQGVVTWGLPSVADDGEVEVVGTIAVFRPTDSVTPNAIWGLYCLASVGAALLFMGQFADAPISMASALDTMLLTFRFRPASNSLVVMIG